jgi:hypothetical protein
MNDLGVGSFTGRLDALSNKLIVSLRLELSREYTLYFQAR